MEDRVDSVAKVRESAGLGSIVPVSRQTCVRIEKHYDGGTVLVAHGALAKAMDRYVAEAIEYAVAHGFESQELGTWERFELIQEMQLPAELPAKEDPFCTVEIDCKTYRIRGDSALAGNLRELADVPEDYQLLVYQGGSLVAVEDKEEVIFHPTKLTRLVSRPRPGYSA